MVKYMRRRQKIEETMTYYERYQLYQERGNRYGSLKAIRDIFTRVIRISARDHNRKPNKDLLRNIRYETDTAYLEKLMYIAIEDDIGAQYVEEKYQEIFRTEEEIISEEYTIYKKYNDDD